MTSRQTTAEPDVRVQSRVTVTLSAKEVTHALRCWIAHQLAPASAPKPKEFHNIQISASADDFGNILSVTADYEPTPPLGD